MTGREIINFASQELIKRPITEDNGIAWINDCLLTELGKDANVFGETIMTACKAGMRYELPPDCISVFEVYDKNNNDFHYWKVSAGRILFAFDGDYTLYYYRIPRKIDLATLEAEIDCHPLLHLVIPYYLAFRFYAPDFMADKETDARYIEFKNKLSMVLEQIQPKRGRIIKTYSWV